MLNTKSGSRTTNSFKVQSASKACHQARYWYKDNEYAVMHTVSKAQAWHIRIPTHIHIFLARGSLHKPFTFWLDRHEGVGQEGEGGKLGGQTCTYAGSGAALQQAQSRGGICRPAAVPLSAAAAAYSAAENPYQQHHSRARLLQAHKPE